jgi:hypothetical protein
MVTISARPSRPGLREYAPDAGHPHFDLATQPTEVFLCVISSVYDLHMVVKLAQDLTDALHANGGSELEVVDPETQRTYLVVDAQVHRMAMEALRRQQDREAIAQGIAEMEAGEGIPLDEARKMTREKLLARRP